MQINKTFHWPLVSLDWTHGAPSLWSLFVWVTENLLSFPGAPVTDQVMSSWFAAAGALWEVLFPKSSSVEYMEKLHSWDSTQQQL